MDKIHSSCQSMSVKLIQLLKTLLIVFHISPWRQRGSLQTHPLSGPLVWLQNHMKFTKTFSHSLIYTFNHQLLYISDRWHKLTPSITSFYISVTGDIGWHCQSPAAIYQWQMTENDTFNLQLSFNSDKWHELVPSITCSIISVTDDMN